MPVLVGALVVGTGLQVYGSMKSASAQRKQAEREARIREMEARETERRTLADIEQTQRSASIFSSQQATAFASAGVDVGSGVSLVMMEEAARNFAERVTDLRLEGEFRAKNIRMGAELNRMVREDNARALELNALGSIVNFGMQMGKK